jgi:hypothetical protein
MEIQSIGLVAAAATFFGVWFGHVAVRKVEFSVEKLWIPIGVTLVVGLGLETWSLFANNLLFAAATGILGMTLLWDSFEFWRQQKRVIKGHAPANPDNLRHAHILADSQDATTLDLLKRDPVDHPVSAEEAVQLMVEKR